MNLLHGYFALRNQQAFQRLLDQSSSDRGQSSLPGQTGVGGKSWNQTNTLNSVTFCDVNARDWLGRTVLHLACASVEPSSIEYVTLLLAHPAINVNLHDLESHWTALHRALYHGNLSAALLLLKRPDIDISLKDLEGYTALDLYNSTLKGTKPSPNGAHAELFTWGTNRNAALGLGDGDNRTYPEQVVIQHKDMLTDSEKMTIDARFSPIHVHQVQMSRLHTVVVTSESQGNLRVCGFGSGGRLGSGQHTQYSLKPLNHFTHKIVSVAVGQDHTLALTDSGEVLSWGLNRFSQLGYVVEPSSTSGAGVGRSDEPIQATPRKILGPLRKETVKGVAASKSASACWTVTDVFTWGTNNGQFGYEKVTQPVQTLPRKVTKLTQPVIAISITDSAMACLLVTQDVVCVWNDRHFKINFPTHAFPFEVQSYRPPQAMKGASICKITSCDDTFAALSSHGELFTFVLPNPSESDGALGKERTVVKPQRVWALRKKFSAVRDVALGLDGSIITCTESGHVFVRSRGASSGQSGASKASKFHRMPYIQRVIKVCANNTGAFGAIRVNFEPKPIIVRGNTLSEDLAGIQPYLSFPFTSIHSEPASASSPLVVSAPQGQSTPLNFEFEDESNEPVIQQDIQRLIRLCGLLARDQESRRRSHGRGLFEDIPLPHGGDVMVHVLQSGAALPAHRVILASRSPGLCAVLAGSKGVIQDQQSNISIRLMHDKRRLSSAAHARLAVNGCHAMSVLVLLEYLYSDELLAVWDHRIGASLEQQLRDVKVKPTQVKTDLQVLARILDLPLLTQALEFVVKCTPPPSMIRDMNYLFHESQATNSSGCTLSRTSPLAPDVVLRLFDKDVFCHSPILRARSMFFACFFDDEDWTAKRWDANGMITIDLTHMKWRVIQFLLGFLCCGGEEELFDTLEFAESPDDVLEFMFEVMAAANELLLDRLVLLCSVVILRYANINNACYILTDAAHFHAQSLVESIQGYIAVNMETLLESRMLDDLPPHLINQLSQFIRQKQSEKAPISRSNILVDGALSRQADWLALQDIPQPIVRSSRPGTRRDPLQLSPSGTGSNRSAVNRPSSNDSLPNSPTVSPVLASHPNDDIFTMDDADSLPTQTSSLPLQPQPAPKDPQGVTTAVAAWKPSSIPRVDMKAVMAEAARVAGSNPLLSPPSVQGDLTNTLKINPRMPQRERRKMQWPAESSKEPSTADSSSLSKSPWRLPSAQPSGVPTSPSSRPSLSRTSDNASSTGLTRAKEAGIDRQTTESSPPAATRGQRMQSTGLGPLFSPSRQPSMMSKLSAARSVSGKAWTLPPVQPVVVRSPPVAEMSFMDIQKSQQEQVVIPGGGIRPLREIQEEEQARQEEEAFLKWWSAEEERVRQEVEAVSQPRHSQKSGRRRPKPHKNTIDPQGGRSANNSGTTA